MAKLLQDIRTPLGEDGPSDRWFLSPPTDVSTQIDLPFVADPSNIIAGARYVAAIVDAGIAFWELAFWTGTGSRFREMVYLDFDEANRNSGIDKRFDQFEKSTLCKVANDAWPQAVVAHLGTRYRGSFFGPGGGADSDQVWHVKGDADLTDGMWQKIRTMMQCSSSNCR